MSELLPCPFCGNEAALYDYDTESGEWPIVCGNLGCGANTISSHSREHAAEKWNRRAPVPAPTVSSDVSDIIAIMADDWLERYSAGDSQWADAQVVRDWLDSLKGE